MPEEYDLSPLSTILWRYRSSTIGVMVGRARREDSSHLARSERLREALRGARRQSGISQQDLASRAGVAIGTVRAVESGRVVEPGFFTVLALADVLGLDAVAASDTGSGQVDPA
jgi:DNA-binding XRE family transcriptional regulator